MGRNKPLPLQDMVDSIVKEAEARVAGADDTVEPDVEKVAFQLKDRRVVFRGTWTQWNK